MGGIEGLEWIGLAIVLVGFLVSVFLVVSVQGDLKQLEETGQHTDEQATRLFIDLLKQTRSQIDIHDDGNDLPESIYNHPEVIAALRDRVVKNNIRVRCLFNDVDQDLKLLDLSRSEECRNRIEIWYLCGGRHEPDIHYKIVDHGRLVHLSKHEHGANERGDRLRRALRWWEFATRRRISKQYREHFDQSLKYAVRATV